MTGLMVTPDFLILYIIPTKSHCFGHSMKIRFTADCHGLIGNGPAFFFSLVHLCFEIVGVWLRSVPSDKLMRFVASGLICTEIHTQNLFSEYAAVLSVESHPHLARICTIAHPMLQYRILFETSTSSTIQLASANTFNFNCMQSLKRTQLNSMKVVANVKSKAQGVQQLEE